MHGLRRFLTRWLLGRPVWAQARRARAEAGFTLLEVVCALAILAGVSGFMVTIWAQSLEKAEYAIDLRRLREVADTVFGKLLFEGDEHSDGDTDTMDNAYGNWAELPQAKRDQWAIYRYELTKRLVTGAGVSDPNSDAESLFGSDDASSPGSSTSGSGTSDEDEEEAGTGVELWKYTMRVYYTESELGQEPLITLQTYIRPVRTAGSNPQ